MTPPFSKKKKEIVYFMKFLTSLFVTLTQDDAKQPSD
jgi:hypothetical protein